MIFMNYTQEELAYIWFDSFFAGEIRIKTKLLEAAESPLDFASNLDKFAPFLIKSKKESVYNNIKASLKSNVYTKKLKADLDKRGIVAVARCSENYPKELFNLENPPCVLYCKGNLSLLREEKFVVVGSRRTLPNILKATERISAELSEHFVVVTGVADGGDGAAIKGAIGEGRIISVLPGGHGNIYPSAMRSVYKEICQKGLAVSEYPYDYRVRKFSFPARNRIIAALGRGVLAVSAGEKSGVLSTVYQALDLGRDVFAFPYTPGIESGVGCNSLIKKGAFLCDNIVDILSCFGIDFKQKEPSLTAEERKILDILRDSEGLHLYEIAEKSGIETASLSVALLPLEMEGLVVKLGGNRYAAVSFGTKSR